MLRNITRCFAVAALLLGAVPAIRAADYPTRPLTLVVAFTPGGASDVLSRILARKLEQILGQPIVIDNRPGAGGNVAAEAVAHAAPDGYTLFTGNNAILATNAALYKKINFDPVADFAPIGLIGSQANILVVNPALPVRSMDELIALARANPGKLNFASSGHGLAAHLAGELFKAEAKIDIVHVPYKGAAPALQDVIAGHVQMMFATASSVVPAHSGRKAAGAGRRHAQAHGDLPRYSDHRRARHQELRCHHLAWAGDAGGHAAGRRRDAQSRAGRHAGGSRGQEIARRSRRRHHRRHAGGVRGLYQIRDSQMDRDHQGVGREAGLTSEGCGSRRVGKGALDRFFRVGKIVRAIAREDGRERPDDAHAAQVRQRFCPPYDPDCCCEMDNEHE